METDQDRCPPMGVIPYRRRRFFTRKKYVQRKRLVEKNGYINLRLQGLGRYSSFVRNLSFLYLSSLGLKWRYVVLVYLSLMVLMWLLFGTVYYLLAALHGDFAVLDEAERPPPCIANCPRYLDYVIYAFATQSTVGYGHRHMTNECVEVAITSMAQVLIGLLMQGILTGFVINKFARPTNRVKTLIFSKSAVIAMRDGKLCLMIRIGDLRKTCLAEAHVRLQLIQKTVTWEGEMLPYHQFEMDVGYKQGLDRVMVMWPITCIHEINEDSPLYEISKEKLDDPNTRFEIIVILEGVVESNGSTTQARTSYTPSEILWGKKFDSLATYHRSDGKYLVDLRKFNSVVDGKNTPPYSAKELDDLRAAGIDIENEWTFDEMSVLNQTTINEVKEEPRKGILHKADSEAVQIESDNEVDEELPEDSPQKEEHLSPSAPRKPHNANIRREFDMF